MSADMRGDTDRPTINWRLVDTPLGAVFVATSARGIVALTIDVPADAQVEDLVRGGRSVDGAVLVDGGGLADEAARQVEEYFGGSRSSLDVPLDLGSETEFTRKVRDAVRAIPRGKTATYGEVAVAAGYPRAARAVGNVMRTNCALLAIPCHRVVASDGLGGFGGRLDLKEWLLRHEGALR